MNSLRLVPLALLANIAFTNPAAAFNGFFAGKKEEPIRSHTTQVVVMKKDATTVVSVMPDYEGPLEGFAMVMLVPGDVTMATVNTLKREFVDRVDQISAPRFHEFWEQDPCTPEPAQQEWERSLKVQGGGFLGGGSITGGKKIAKELYLDVEAKQKEGEYKFTLLPGTEDPIAWLKGKGYRPPNGADGAVKPYLAAGMQTLVAEVDAKRIELIGGDRAQLSPIRYGTSQPFTTVLAKPGLLNSPGKQELFIYVLDPKDRYEAKNYKTLYPPTNIAVDFSVKERVGEFYNALYDIILQKNPNSFLAEYAWPAGGCGQPCATEPLMIHELLSLGADIFERSVPEEVRNPPPPELSKEEKEAQQAELKLLKPKERREREKQIKEERQTVVSRKGLLERHQYLLSRLHYRYDAASLPEDPTIGAASGGVEGGIALPKGEKMEVSTEVKSTGASRFQTRYNNFHPWKPVIQCQTPERGKWGKSPPDYRGLRKIWIADDLSRKSRTQIKPAKVVLTPLPDLGLGAAAANAGVADAGVDAGAAAAEGESGKCSCSIPDATGSRAGFAGALVALVALVLRRRVAR
jgi:MYXO-CTERM domain-containing protein